MKKKDIRELSEIELEKLQSDTIEEIGKLRFQKALGQIDNVHLIRNKRKFLARILTIRKEKFAGNKTVSTAGKGIK